MHGANCCREKKRIVALGGFALLNGLRAFFRRRRMGEQRQGRLRLVLALWPPTAVLRQTCLASGAFSPPAQGRRKSLAWGAGVGVADLGLKLPVSHPLTSHTLSILKQAPLEPRLRMVCG